VYLAPGLTVVHVLCNVCCSLLCSGVVGNGADSLMFYQLRRLKQCNEFWRWLSGVFHRKVLDSCFTLKLIFVFLTENMSHPVQCIFEELLLIPKRFQLHDVRCFSYRLHFLLLASVCTGSEEMSGVGRLLHWFCFICLQLIPRVAKCIQPSEVAM